MTENKTQRKKGDPSLLAGGSSSSSNLGGKGGLLPREGKVPEYLEGKEY